MPIDWPSEFDQTPPDQREPYPHNFRVSQERAFENIVTQVERMDNVARFEIETAADHLPNEPNVPVPGASPSDPGVIVWIFLEDKGAAENRSDRMIFPCDRWSSLRDNAQAVGKYIEAKRALDRYGVHTLDTEFATQRPQKRRVDR